MIDKTINIHCRYDALVNPLTLKNHHKNANKHDQSQIDRLAKLYEYHGVRHPIIVSKLSGLIVSGHCRKSASIRAGMVEFPVVYQDFNSTDEEYAFMVSDNTIAEWSELDFMMLNQDMTDLGPGFDLDMLGLKNFKLDPSDKKIKTKTVKTITCPHCFEEFEDNNGKG